MKMLIAVDFSPVGREAAFNGYRYAQQLGADVTFSVNGLTVLSYHDDGETYGPLLTGGKIGFRQLAPMIGEYANLQVWELQK